MGQFRGGFWGNPDPLQGDTGTNVYGVNLSGDYSVAPGGPYYVIGGPFDCQNYDNIILQFSRWLNADESGYVRCTIEVSNDINTWQVVWEHDGRLPIIDDYWRTVRYDLSDVADGQQQVYIRWSYKVLNNALPYSGWNIDDIQLWGNVVSVP